MWRMLSARRARAVYLFAVILPILLLSNYFGPEVISPESRASLQRVRITYQEAADRLIHNFKESARLKHFGSHGVEDKEETGLCKGRPCSKARAKPLRHIVSQQPLLEDKACLEEWLLRGEVCSTLDLSNSNKIDAVWTWVNGTEPRHGLLRRRYMAEMPQATFPEVTASGSATGDDPLQDEEGDLPAVGMANSNLGDEVTMNYGTAESRFRDNNELLFAVRSVHKHLGSSLGNMHIITPDFPDEEEYRAGEGESSTTFTVEEGRFRLGQVPRWLDVEHSQVRTGEAARHSFSGKQDSGQLYVHHNWDTFSPILAPDLHLSGAKMSSRAKKDASAEEWTEEQMFRWKSNVVPNFNSIAIECTMGSDRGMADAYYYANDDMYLGRDISAADMISPLFGPSLLIRKSKMVAPWRDAPFNLGYNAELYYSNALLSDRFGIKPRPYVSHTQKIVSQPLMDEMKLLFHEQVADLRRFRATGPDINFAFMLYHTIIERHREALLWSFFVARADQDGDGHYSAQETRDMVHDLGIDQNLVRGKGVSKVFHPVRDAWKEGEMSQALRAAQYPAIKNTTIRFSAMESGYASSKLFNVGPVSWPNFASTKVEDEGKKHACNIAAACVQKVLRGDSTSESLFTFFAFEQPECGDCAITQLLGNSGRKGYSSFLPKAELAMPDTLNADVEEFWESAEHRQDRVAHLPLTDHWNKSDFSLAGVAAASGLGGTDRQYFAMQLIQRYQYSVSYSPQILGLLKDEVSTEGFFEEFASSQMTWICINDEMDEGVSPASAAHIYAQIDALLKTLFDDALPFERKPQNDDDGEDDQVQ